MDINAEIAWRIMGWQFRAEGAYWDPKRQAMTALPNFVMADNGLLRETMKSQGYELTITENPTDLKKNIGKTFTASFSRQNKSFQTTQDDERTAVCVAALKACGMQLSNDR